MLPLLQLAVQTSQMEVSAREAADTLADQFKRTAEERTALFPSGATFVFASRVNWACTYLKKVGLLVATRRGFFRTRSVEQTCSKSKPKRLDNWGGFINLALMQ